MNTSGKLYILLWDWPFTTSANATQEGEAFLLALRVGSSNVSSETTEQRGVTTH